MNSAPSVSIIPIPITIDDSPTPANNPIDVDALQTIKPIEIVDVEPAPDPKIESTSASCTGIIVNIPPGMSTHSAYPFGLHDELGDPWDYSVVAGQLTLRARGCRKKPRPGKDKCVDCNGLSQNPTLQGVLDRIEFGVHENSRLAYHGVGGLVKIVRKRTAQVNSLRLQKLNDSRKLMGKVTALDNHKEWIMAISSSKVERVDRLIRNGLKRRLGIRSMIDMLENAAKKVYRPKNYSEEDMLHGLLFWRLGGGRVAEFAHSLDLPSLRTLRRNTIVSPIIASAAFPTVLEIQQNTHACIGSIADLLRDTSLVHQILMFDELKVEERLRWDDKTNMIQGVCREHGKVASLEYTSRHEVDLLFDMLEQEEVHFSTNVREIIIDQSYLIKLITHTGNRWGNWDYQRKPSALWSIASPCFWPMWSGEWA